MTESTAVTDLLNPFPATAVARLLDVDLPTIETTAIKQSQAFLKDYLSRSSEKRDDQATGSTIAVVGEYGTGKTHLAVGLLRALVAEDDSTVQSFYLDAPADTFLALYRDRFISQLKRRALRDRIEEYLLDIVAEHLRSTPMTSAAADQLVVGESRPLEIINDLGLMEADLLRKLRVRLRAVTEKDDYSVAMSLLLRPEFEDAVWEWLKGSPPDPALQERGIVSTIDSEAAALEALGVLAFIFGRRGHRFVLLIDEMEKVLSSPDRGELDASAMLAFKKLMEALSMSRSLLVLVGLPDFLEVLPRDAQDRLAAIIRPSLLGASETTQYIREANKRASGRATLTPFTRDTAAYIAELTGGNARRVVRLCYHAYLAAREANTAVTRAMLREVARAQFEYASQEDASTEITRVIDSNGWKFERNKALGTAAKSRVDFWLPVGEAGSGLIVLLSRSILHPEDADKLVTRLQSQTDSREPAVLSLLVVNGYLADNLGGSLDEAFDRVLTYHGRRFGEDFEAAVKGLRQRLEEATREDVLAYLRERIDQLSRQSGYLVDRTEQILRIVPDSALLDAAVANGVRQVFAQAAGSTSVGSLQRYPATTQVLDRADVLATQLESRSTQSALLALGISPSLNLQELERRIPTSSGARVLDIVIPVAPLIASLRLVRRCIQALLGSTSSAYVDDIAATDFLSSLLSSFDRVLSECASRLLASADSTDLAVSTPIELELLTREATSIPRELFDALRDDLDNSSRRSKYR